MSIAQVSYWPFRNITADGLTGTHDAVETHAASVLQRYAEKSV